MQPPDLSSLNLFFLRSPLRKALTAGLITACCLLAIGLGMRAGAAPLASPATAPSPAPDDTASKAVTISLPLLANGTAPAPTPPLAQIQRVDGAGPVPLQGSILNATTLNVRLELLAGATGVSVRQQASGGPAQDITGQFVGLEATGTATAALSLPPGDHTLTVSATVNGQARSQSAGFLLLEDDSTLIASSPVTFPNTTDASVGLAFEDRTVLLAFTDKASREEISAFLAAADLRPLDVALPFGLLRVQIPGGETPLQTVQRLTALNHPLLAAATLNFALEDDVATGERMPTRLANSYRASAGAGCTAGGSTIEGCFDFSGDPDNNSADELRIFRYHFFMDTFAAHRLVEHLVMTATQSAGVAIVDRGLGNGTNTSDIPNGSLFNLSSAPFVFNAAGIQTRHWNGAAWVAGPPPIARLADRASGHGTSVTAAAAGRGTQVLGPGLHVQVRPMRRTHPNFAQSVFAVLGAARDPQVDVVNTSWGGFGLTPAQFTSLNLGAFSENVLRYASMPFLDVGLDGNRGTVDADGSQGNGRFDFTDGDGDNVHDNGEASEPFTDRNGNGAFDAFDALVWVASTGNNNGQDIGTTRLPGAFAPDANPRGQWNPLDGFNQQRELTMLAVSASGTNDRIRGAEELASYSNWGQRTSVAGPGDAMILPDRNGNLRRISGTSFAAPTVAGLAGEMIYLDKNLGQTLTSPQIIELIEATADDLGTSQAAVNTTRPNDRPGNTRDNYFGHGRVNVWKAILAVVNRGVATESHTSLGTDFPSLTAVGEADTRWYGFKIHTPLRNTTAWLDGVQIADASSTAPGNDIRAYAGVATDRTIRIGVKNEDPTSGIVPVGSTSDFLLTFSIERSDLIKAGGKKSLQLRRPGQTAADAPFFLLELDLAKMRQGELPGVVFDDFVFEITPPDFGDASASPTSLADDGARHLNFQLEYFGKANATFSLDAVSPEHKVFGVPDPDGITNWGINLEDLDGHDDGLVFYPLSYKPGATGRVDVQVCVDQPGSRYDRTDADKQIFVNGWIDWNTNGSWEEGAGGEHVLDGMRLAITDTTPAAWTPLTTTVGSATVTLLSSNDDCGNYKVEFPVPGAIGKGKIESRWRLDYGENVGRHANGDFPSAASLSQTKGPAFYGEVEDYVIGSDFGDAGKDAPWPTKLDSNGARHLSFYREWIGPFNSGTPTASREPDACKTGGSDQDGSDNLGDNCDAADADALDNFSVTILEPGKILVEFEVSSTVEGYGFDGGNKGVQTLRPDCSLAPLGGNPATPAHQQVEMRYDAGNSAERLYVNLFADWDGDGSFESTVLSAPVDPEDFGTDGVYTLGEPFVDGNSDGVWNSGESFTDVAGVDSRKFACVFPAPVPPPAEITQWLRMRLDYGENVSSIRRGDPYEEDPLHVPAKSLGGAVWGEVEDLPLGGGQPPRHREWTWEVPPGVPFTTGPIDTADLPGEGPYTFQLVTNEVILDGMANTPLPDGLSLDPATGEISGIVREPGIRWPLVGIYEGFGTPAQEFVGADWHHFEVPVHITTHLLDQQTGRPITGYPLNLYRGQTCTGTPVQSGTTDGEGMLWFPDLNPEQYAVELTQQPGFTGVGNTCQSVDLSQFVAMTRTQYFSGTAPSGPGQVEIPVFAALWQFRGAANPQNEFALLQGQALIDFQAARPGSGGSVWDQEMLSLDLHGQSNLGQILIRESPQQQSTGQATLTELGDGQFRVDSFFDVWTELSVDGGETWQQTEAPARFQTQSAHYPPYGSTATANDLQYQDSNALYLTQIFLDPTEQALLFLARTAEE